MASRTRFRLPPPAVLALLYAAFITVGTLVLMLPVAQEQPVAPIDAFFIATSAVTVTGLITIDPGTSFTLLGEIVVAILIQFGGLGLMTFAVLVVTAVGIDIGMPSRLILREELNQTSTRNVLVLARVVLVFAVVGEILGAAILAFVFVPDYGWYPGLWHAIFHAISALNNAGFSTFSDSLSGYVGNPLINIVVPVLFILSGLGFVVIADIWQKQRWARLTLHSKLMLAGTAALIGVAFVGFAALEWYNPGTLGGMDLATKIQATWFQAVTPRTAGFNTLATGEMYDSTTLMTMALMVIGGGSTSTAGGIKVTTFIVFLLATVAFFKRGSSLTAFGRSIGLTEVLKVMAITTISAIFILFALFAVLLANDGDFLVLAFEVASAFGTVGLSIGATGELDATGKLVIMAVMFIGRLGPLTLGFFLVTGSRPRVRYPAGQIHLG